MNQNSKSRNDSIFEIIVESYIETAEPVGSKMVSRCCDEGLSSATIRNVMAALEEEGLIHQPHTSAGRVPTDKGYRYYVDYLMRPSVLTDEERRWMASELSKSKTLDGMAARATKIVSDLTHNAAMVYFKNVKRASFLSDILEQLADRQLLEELFEEEAEFFIEGIRCMLEQPEFQDVQKLKNVLQVFDQKEDFVELFRREIAEEHRPVHIHIGRENHNRDLEDVSVVAKDYTVSRVPIGGIAVVGPTRMQYTKVVSVVDYMADRMAELLKGF